MTAPPKLTPPESTDGWDSTATPPGFLKPSGPTPEPFDGYIDAQPDQHEISGSFSVSLDGAASYSVPIEVPPGRLGTTPKLALSYRSDAPAGAISNGWSIGELPEVTRCPRTIHDDGALKDVTFDTEDALCLNGLRLVAVFGAFGGSGTEYRTIPDTNTKVVSNGGNWAPTQHTGPDSFTVYTADDRVLTFGGTPDSTMARDIVNYRWLLRQNRDTAGNHVDYNYTVDGGHPYLSMVEYGGFLGSPSLTHDKRLELVYSTPRDDAFTQYRWGQTFTINRRLEEIQVTIGGSTLVRRYGLAYQWDANTSRYELATLSECVPTSTGEACKRPKRFQYLQSRPGLDTSQQLTIGVTHPNLLLADQTWERVGFDANGDGRTDFAYPCGGSSAWSEPSYWVLALAPNYQPLQTSIHCDDGEQFGARQRTIVADFDGDGLQDLLLLDIHDNWRILRSTGSTLELIDTGVQKLTGAIAGLTAGLLRDIPRGNRYWETGTYVGDYNGDGLPDIVNRALPTDIIGSTACLLVDPEFCSFDWLYYENIGGTFSPGVPIPGMSSRPLKDSRGYFVLDWDGDGLDELMINEEIPGSYVLPATPEWSIIDVDSGAAGPSFAFTHLGGGLFSSLRGGIQLPLQWDFTVLDINGDSIPDFFSGNHIYIGTGAGYYLDSAITSHGSGIYATWVPRLDDSSSARTIVLDWNSDGRDDVLVPVWDSSPLGEPVIQTKLLPQNEVPGCPLTVPSCFVDVDVTPRGVYKYYILLLSNGTGFDAVDPALEVPCPTQSATPNGCDPADSYFGVPNTIDFDGDGARDIIFPYTDDLWVRRPAVDPSTGAVAEGRAGALTGIYNEVTLELASNDPNLGGGLLKRSDTEVEVAYSPLRVANGPAAILAGGWREEDVYFRTGETCTFPCMPLVAPGKMVVAQTKAGEASSDRTTTRYRYEDGFQDLHGRGFLGFRSVLTQHTPDNAPVETGSLLGGHRYGESWRRLVSDPTQFDTDLKWYPNVGHVLSSVRFGTGTCGASPTAPSGVWASASSSQRDVQTRADGATFAYVDTARQEYTFDCYGGSPIELGVVLDDPVEQLLWQDRPDHISTVTFESYDDFGNPTLYTVSDESVGIDPQPITTTIESTYDNSVSNWRVGQLTWMQVRDETSEGSATRSFRYQYDPVSGLVSETSRGESTAPNIYQRTSLGRDAFGNLTRMETFDADGHRLRQQLYTFDSRGDFIETVTNGLGQTTWLYHEPRFGRLVAEEQPTGARGWATYDGMGVLRLLQNGDGSWAQMWAGKRQDGAEIVLSRHSQRSGGSLQAEDLDRSGRVVARHSVGLRGQTFTEYLDHDERGRVSQRSRPVPFGGAGQHWYRYEYDRRSRLRLVTDPDGSTQEVFRDATRTWWLDRRNNPQYVTFDGRGRPTEHEDALGQVSTRSYGPFGTLVRAEAFGDLTLQDYDDYGRRLSVLEPNTGTSSFVFDALDQLTEATDAESRTIKVCRDGLGRRTHELRAADGFSEWFYGPLGDAPVLTRESSSDGLEREYNYDSLGRLSFVLTRIETTPGTVEEFGNYRTFDNIGRVTRFGSGYAAPAAALSLDANRPLVDIEVVFDGYGHPTGILDADKNLDLWRWTEPGPENQIAATMLGNGVEGRFTFHAQTGLPDDILAFPPVGHSPQPLQQLSYGWDANGNLASHTDGRQGRTEIFQYDALNRLAGTLSESGNHDYRYSPNGNLTKKPGVSDIKYSDPSHPNAITEADGETYKYTPTGNQAQRPTSSGALDVTYSYFNKPRSVVSTQGSTTFSYDARYRRFKKSDASGTKIYIDENFERIDLAGGGQEHRFLIEGPRGPFLMVEYSGQGPSITKEHFYLHRDVRGSLDVVTDGLGKFVQRQSYHPFGERRHPDWSITTPPGPPARDFMLGFTGHEDEDELGWINMKGRLYDPHVGRFMNADLLAGDPSNAQKLNRYSYVLNNPMTLVDPNGYQEYDPYVVDVIGQRVPKGGYSGAAAPPSVVRHCRACLPDPSQGGAPGQVYPIDGQDYKLIEYKDGDWSVEPVNGEGEDDMSPDEFLDTLKSIAEALGWEPPTDSRDLTDDPRATFTQKVVGAAGLCNLELSSSPDGSPDGLPGGGLDIVPGGAAAQWIYVAATVASFASGAKAAVASAGAVLSPIRQDTHRLDNPCQEALL